jgi:hypothetical protein
MPWSRAVKNDWPIFKGSSSYTKTQRERLGYRLLMQISLKTTPRFDGQSALFISSSELHDSNRPNVMPVIIKMTDR